MEATRRYLKSNRLYLNLGREPRRFSRARARVRHRKMGIHSPSITVTARRGSNERIENEQSPIRGNEPESPSINRVRPSVVVNVSRDGNNALLEK